MIFKYLIDKFFFFDTTVKFKFCCETIACKLLMKEKYNNNGGNDSKINFWQYGGPKKKLD